MIEIAALLMAVASGPVTIPQLSCERDADGDCILDYSLKPRLRLAESHRELALKIYRPYFDCYYARLIASVDFGTSNGEAAASAMTAAGSSCSSERGRASGQMLKLLEGAKIYGDADHRAYVDDLFRREEGSDYVWSKAKVDGLGDQLDAMSNAYFEHVIDNNDRP